MRNLFCDKLRKVWHKLLQALVALNARQSSSAKSLIVVVDLGCKDRSFDLIEVEDEFFGEDVLDLRLEACLIGTGKS